MSATILAIESSCDETSASVICGAKVLNNVIASQSVHQKYGGVVPELASRAHQRNIINVVNDAVTDSDITLSQIDAIAFTRGPGLMGSLLVGVSFAKGLALALGKPLIEVNHMEAHILAHFIDDPKPAFPFLCLTVSGGHTQIVLVKNYLDFVVLGETLDDAVGEAFDKAAKLLGLPYPGGPFIDQYAQKGDPQRFTFSETQVPALNFSFSGIKTSLLYFLRDQQALNSDFIQENMADICASYQRTLVNMLLQKLAKAVKETGVSTVALAGGVAANAGLRSALQVLANEKGRQVFIPAFQHCTDNAAMVAMAAHYLYREGRFAPLDIVPAASLPVGLNHQ